MNAFLLLEYSKRPFKVKGKTIIPAIAVPLNRNGVTAHGTYVGIGHGTSLNVIDVGYSTTVSPELREAFFAMNAINIGIGVNVFHDIDLTSDVYVLSGSAASAFRFRGALESNHGWDNFFGYWIPSRAMGGGNIFEVWCRVLGESADVLRFGDEKECDLEISALNLPNTTVRTRGTNGWTLFDPALEKLITWPNEVTNGR